jgi:hypothetical protein
LKKTVKIRVLNGLEFEYAVDAIFKINGLCDDFDFVNDEVAPHIVLFGPYGNNIPARGNYIRVGYYCESISPDLNNCEWAFGVPRDEEINNYRYKRIQWQGTDPQALKKNIDADEIFKQKNKFCNFLYSNPIPYREEFFRQLSKYKKVDSPGLSMNNALTIDKQYTGDKWEIKRQFLQPYKFTIAFESYCYPGYQTEKLYDAMRINSIPIYCGDPLIGDIFNQDSFINAFDHVKTNDGLLKNALEKFGQYNFNDYRPGVYNSLYYKIRRKLKTWAKFQKMRVQLNKLDFSPLIEKIIELDTNPDLYIAMLKQPWLVNNKVPDGMSFKARWVEIFNAALTR